MKWLWGKFFCNDFDVKPQPDWTDTHLWLSTRLKAESTRRIPLQDSQAPTKKKNEITIKP